jgi:predicted transglutaminase-like cysteine proteinase
MRILLAGFVLTTYAFAANADQIPVVKREAPVSALSHWNDFAQRQDKTMDALRLCRQDVKLCASPDAARWSDMMRSIEGANRLRQIITVNRWFNRLPYQFDEDAYDRLDHWADTRELFERRGDCEDYALSKYYTLRLLGFTPQEMKVTAVYDTQARANHAVLLIYTGDTRYMLDINSDSTDPDYMNWRYRPLYAFNETTAWYY